MGAVRLFSYFLLIFSILHQTYCGTCKYSLLNDLYQCELKDAYILMEDSLLLIDGDHLEGFTDEHVKKITISSSVIHYLHETLLLKFQNVEEIHFDNAEIFEINPSAFLTCHHLQILSIDDEDLKTLPPHVFQNCSMIKEITIRAVIEVLPSDAFYGLENLEKLDLSGNYLEVLPDLSGLRRLEGLNLGMNKIKNLENPFEENTNLLALDLSANDLTNLHENIFINLKNLENLFLQNNSLANLNPKLFKNLKFLSTLDLSNNDLENLPESSFTNLNLLKTLYLDFNEISELRLESFGNHSEVKIFTIDSNDLNQIERDFFKKFQSLEYFSSRDNKCFNGFILGSSEQPIDFENEEIVNLLKNCYDGSNDGFPLFFLWIGLAVAVIMCGIFLFLHFRYERSAKRTVEITA